MKTSCLIIKYPRSYLRLLLPFKVLKILTDKTLGDSSRIRHLRVRMQRRLSKLSWGLCPYKFTAVTATHKQKTQIRRRIITFEERP